MASNSLDHFSREELLDLCKLYAKNWLAHDGAWFLSVEEKLGLDAAVEIDTEAWRKFTVIEARRLIDFLSLGRNSGVEGLRKALSTRLYTTLNEDHIVVQDDRTLFYYVKTCRVQAARRKKGLPDFACKPVGLVEHELFARTIDERFATEALSCPPDVTDPDFYCVWRFILR